MLQAITRQALKVDQKVATHNAALAPGQQQMTIAHFFDHFATEDDISVTVTEEDFQSAHRDLVPSVSAEELGHYEKVRKAFEGSGTPSSKPASQQPPPAPPPSQQQQHIRPASQHSVGRPPTVRRTSSSNGSRNNGQRSDKSTFYFDPAAALGDDDDDDEYVIRTDHLGSNGHSNGRPVGKGNGNGNIFGGGGGGDKGSRGKGKAAFGSATDGDEGLYE
jgi:peroxin-6